MNCSGHRVQASVTSSVAIVHHNNSDKIEVKLNPIRIADILVNGEQMEVETGFSYFQLKGKYVRYLSLSYSIRFSDIE